MVKQHLLASFNYSGIQSDKEIYNLFHSALEYAGAHIRRSIEYEFNPLGLTAMVVLGESHAVISTWPREGILDLDYFSCAKDPGFNKLIDYFQKNGFECYKSQIIDR